MSFLQCGTKVPLIIPVQATWQHLARRNKFATNRTWINRSLSEMMWTVRSSSYNGPDSSRRWIFKLINIARSQSDGHQAVMTIHESTRDRDRSSRSTAPSDGPGSISSFIRIVLRGEEQVRDYPSNSPCLENHFACRLFKSVLHSFPLQLNA